MYYYDYSHYWHYCCCYPWCIVARGTNMMLHSCMRMQQLMRELGCASLRSSLGTMTSLCCKLGCTLVHTCARAVTRRKSCVETRAGIPDRLWPVETICRTAHQSAYSLPHRQEFDRSLSLSRARQCSRFLHSLLSFLLSLRSLLSLFLAPAALSNFNARSPYWRETRVKHLERGVKLVETWEPRTVCYKPR